MSARDVYLISTPIQAFFAYMIARQRANKSEFIVVTSYQQSVEQIAYAAQLLGMGHISYITDRRYSLDHKIAQIISGLDSYRKTARLVKLLGKQDTLFIGVLAFPPNRPAVFGAKQLHLALFDEGLATFGFLKQREEGRLDVQFPRHHFHSLYTALYPKMLHLPAVEFHTIYPALRGAEQDKIVQVKVDFGLKQKQKQAVNEIWYISGPLVQLGVLSSVAQATMLDTLRLTALRLNARLIYFAHRSEKVVAQHPDIEIRVGQLPFELAYMGGSQQPLAIVSVISSVLLNFQLLFRDGCPVYFLHPDGKHNVEHVASIQSYAYEAVGIPTLRASELEPVLLASAGQRC